MRFSVDNRITINAPAERVWHLLAHQFGTIGEWASSIPASQALIEIPALPETEVAGRVCSPAIPGFAAVHERFTSYDEQAMRFSYQATEGLPRVIQQAKNHWSVRALGPHACEVEARAELRIGLFSGVLFVPLLKLQLGRVSRQLFEEMKYYVEQGQVHSRKQKAQQKQKQQEVLSGGRP